MRDSAFAPHVRDVMGYLGDFEQDVITGAASQGIGKKARSIRVIRKGAPRGGHSERRNGKQRMSSTGLAQGGLVAVAKHGPAHARDGCFHSVCVSAEPFVVGGDEEIFFRCRAFKRRRH